jgi:hypothetical protein
LMIEADQIEKQEAETSGIFSSSTLAALQSAQVSLSSKLKAAAPSGPLVAYDSDSD